MLDEKAEILDVKAEMLYKKYWTTRQTCCTRNTGRQGRNAVPEAQRRRVQAASVPEAHRHRVQAASVSDAQRRKNPSGQRTRSVQDARVRQAPRSFATMQEKLLCHVGEPAPCARRQRDSGHQCLHSGERTRRHVRTSCQRTKRQRDSGHQCSHSGERTRRHVRTRRQRTRRHHTRQHCRCSDEESSWTLLPSPSRVLVCQLRACGFTPLRLWRLILFTEGIQPSLLFFGERYEAYTAVGVLQRGSLRCCSLGERYETSTTVGVLQRGSLRCCSLGERYEASTSTAVGVLQRGSFRCSPAHRAHHVSPSRGRAHFGLELRVHA